MHVLQHIPGFVEGFQPTSAEVKTAAELVALPFVQRWKAQPGFRYFAVAGRESPQPLLMAVLEKEAYVLAYLSGDQTLDFDLPDYARPRGHV